MVEPKQPVVGNKERETFRDLMCSVKEATERAEETAERAQRNQKKKPKNNPDLKPLRGNERSR